MDKGVENFRRLIWRYDDILNDSVDSLINIVNDLGNSSEMNHLENKSSIYTIESSQILKPQFIKLLNLMGLSIRHNSAFLIVPPNTSGPAHTDTYYHDICNVSLHFDLSEVGRLEFFDSNTTGTPALTNGTDYNIIDDKIADAFDVIDFMPAAKTVSIVRTNKPHRAVNDSDKFRMVLTCRFENNPTFEHVESKLKKFIQQR